MSLRTVGERPRHNPYQLCCSFANCHRWFRNQSRLTNHLRSGHPRQVALPQAQYQCSPPSANADEAQNTHPIHQYNESSSQGDQYSTPPLARSQFHPLYPISAATQDRPSNCNIKMDQVPQSIVHKNHRLSYLFLKVMSQ